MLIGKASTMTLPSKLTKYIYANEIEMKYDQCLKRKLGKWMRVPAQPGCSHGEDAAGRRSIAFGGGQIDPGGRARVFGAGAQCRTEDHGRLARPFDGAVAHW